MVRWLVCMGVIAVLSCGILAQDGDLGSVPSSAREGSPRLGLSFKLPGKRTLGPWSWVMILKNGKVLSKSESVLNRPIVIPNLPSGLLEVVVIPIPGRNSQGYVCRQKVNVKPKGLTAVSLNLTAEKLTRIQLTVTDTRGDIPPISKVRVTNVTDAVMSLSRVLATKTPGEFEFYVSSGQSYVLRAVALKPTEWFTSKPFRVDKNDAEWTWALRRGPMLTLRFVSMESGRAEPIRDIKYLNLRSSAGRSTFPIRGGVLKVSKSHRLLRGQKALRLELVNPRYRIAQTKPIPLTVGKTQEVDVIVEVIRMGSLKINIVLPKGSRPYPWTSILLRNRQKGARFRFTGIGTNATGIPVGINEIFIWGPRCKLAKKSVVVKDQQMTEVVVKLKKSPVWPVQVLGSGGNPVPDIQVRVIYTGSPRLSGDRSITDKDGKARVAADPRQEPWIVVRRRGGFGGVLVPVKPLSAGDTIVIKMKSPRKIAGRFLFDEKLERTVGSAVWGVLAVRKDVPGIILAVSRVEKGRFNLELQPGEYVLLAVHKSHYVTLGPVNVPRAAESLKKDFSISLQLWKTRKPMGNLQ